MVEQSPFTPEALADLRDYYDNTDTSDELQDAVEERDFCQSSHYFQLVEDDGRTRTHACSECEERVLEDIETQSWWIG